MTTVHLVCGPSAGGGLEQAIRAEQADHEIVVVTDDFSCGPIDPASLSHRTEWWQSTHSGDMAPLHGDPAGSVRAALDRVASADATPFSG